MFLKNFAVKISGQKIRLSADVFNKFGIIRNAETETVQFVEKNLVVDFERVGIKIAFCGRRKNFSKVVYGNNPCFGKFFCNFKKIFCGFIYDE